MGRDKAALPCPDFDGETFFSIATRRLQRHCQRIVISGQCSVTHAFPVIEDSAHQQGPMLGVLASLDYASSEGFQACLVTPVDVPFLSDHDLQQLIKHWAGQAKLTVAFSSRIEPLIAIYPTSMIDDLRHCVSDDQLSLMRWIKSTEAHRVSVSVASCRNINRPDDLKSEPLT
jgi:molybdopterin-guanine dinucleotide biosynthesis protein A